MLIHLYLYIWAYLNWYTCCCCFVYFCCGTKYYGEF